MGRVKELYMDLMKAKMQELIDQGMDMEEAYDKASEAAYHALPDTMADLGDREKQRLKDEGKWPPRHD